MSEDLKHDEIIAEAREKYTVHHCGQCEFRKSCCNKFDSDECKNTRQSIMLGFGIEDGYFTKLLDRLEAAHKREATCEKSSQVGNNAKMREALQIVLDELLWLTPQIIHIRKGEKCTPPWVVELGLIVKAALDAPPRPCDVMSLEAAKKVWFAKEIIPRLNGDLPLGKEVSFAEWFVSESEQKTKGETK